MLLTETQGGMQIGVELIHNIGNDRHTYIHIDIERDSQAELGMNDED